jgi:signal transduction histidine kinase/CheY-like chemotaxis protein
MILEQNSELDKHRSKLEILVEERARELTEAKEKAEESDRLKSSFLANLSHEIRTPLNAILGFSSLLGDSSLDAAERREYNRIIRSSSNTLLDLISDILDISRIEAGQMELVPGPVSLEGLISDIKGIYDLFARREDIGWNKTVEFRIKMDERMKHLHILADKLRLEQVLSNLLSNALKFTHKGFVELGCSITGEPAMLTFYVKDTGIGIKEEHQKVIFERFRKLEDDKTRLQRGTGLGLSISARLVNLMGGNLSLISKEDEGSVFTFAVPLVLTSETRVEPQKPALSNQVPDLQDSLILVAEDDFSNYQYMEKLLKKANARVLHATNGLEVLKMLEVHSDIRLIFMDIKMPEMDGIETLVEMKRRNIHIPVIAQTAYVLADEVVKLKNEGFHDYIAKPIPMEDLYILVHKYTGVPNQSA